MANPNRVAGQAVITVDGDRLETDGQSTLELGGPVRTAVPGDYQVGSFSEKEQESKMTVSILLKKATRVTDLRRIDNATLTLRTDVGQLWMVRNAYVAEVITINTSDGKAQVVFQGPPAEELTL